MVRRRPRTIPAELFGILADSARAGAPLPVRRGCAVAAVLRQQAPAPHAALRGGSLRATGNVDEPRLGPDRLEDGYVDYVV